MGGTDGSAALVSGFRAKDGQVYWLSSIAMDLRSDGGVVHSFFASPSPVKNMVATETYDTDVIATATFADGNIHILIKEGNTTIYDEVYTKGA